jgi:hypothetical protein
VEPRGLPKVASRLETEPRRFPRFSSCGLCRSPCWDCATRSGNFLLSQCTRIIPCRFLNSQRIGGTTTTTTTTVPYHIVFATFLCTSAALGKLCLFLSCLESGSTRNCHATPVGLQELTRKKHNALFHRTLHSNVVIQFPHTLYAGLQQGETSPDMNTRKKSTNT